MVLQQQTAVAYSAYACAAAAILAAAALTVQPQRRKRTTSLLSGCQRLCLSRQDAHALQPDLFAEVAAQLPGGAAEELQELTLSGYGIARLPAAHLATLGALARLDLSRNALTALPPEVRLLTALVDLDVSRNRLRSLPPDLGRLTRLRLLNCMANELDCLPEELGDLASLYRLGLKVRP